MVQRQRGGASLPGEGFEDSERKPGRGGGLRKSLGCIYLTTRTSAQHVVYLLGDDFPFKQFLLQVSKYYPQPAPVYPFKSGVRVSEQLHTTNDYLFVGRFPREAKIIKPTAPQGN